MMMCSLLLLFLITLASGKVSPWFTPSHDNYKTNFGSHVGAEHISKTNWTVTLSTGDRYEAPQTNPAVDSKGNIFIQMIGRDYACHLFKFSPSGTLLWKSSIAPYFSQDLVMDDMDNLYLFSESLVYVLDSTTGDLLKVWAVPGDTEIQSMAVVSPNQLFLFLDETTLVLLIDGKVAYRYSVLGKGSGHFQSHSFNDDFTGIVMFVSNTPADENYSLVSLSLDPTGKSKPTLNWKHYLGTQVYMSIAYHPIMDAFVISGLTKAMNYSIANMTMIDLKGNVIWEAETCEFEGYSPSVDPVSGLVVWGCTTNTAKVVRAVDGKTGKTLWTKGPNDYYVLAPQFSIRSPWKGAGSGLIVMYGMPADGRVWLMNPRDGSILGSFPIPGWNLNVFSLW